MLDYTQMKEPEMPIKMADGKVLHLLCPDAPLLDKMVSLQSGKGDIYNVCLEVLNNNKHFIKYELEEVRKLRLPFLMSLFKEYGKFIETIQNDPN